MDTGREVAFRNSGVSTLSSFEFRCADGQPIPITLGANMNIPSTHDLSRFTSFMTYRQKKNRLFYPSHFPAFLVVTPMTILLARAPNTTSEERMIVRVSPPSVHAGIYVLLLHDDES